MLSGEVTLSKLFCLSSNFNLLTIKKHFFLIFQRKLGLTSFKSMSIIFNHPLQQGYFPPA